MTEDTKTTDDKTTDPKADERRVPESALIKQAEEFRTQIAALQKELGGASKFKADHEAEQAKAEEARAIAASEFEKVLGKRDADIADKDALIAGFKRKEVVGIAKDDLRSRGMTDELKIKGALTELPGEVDLEQIAEWTRTLAEKNPAWFTAPATPVTQSQVGTPHTGSTSTDLKTRLKSEDVKVRMEALNEQFAKQSTGELALDWNKD